MVIMETHQITQLTVYTKNPGAGLFDTGAYQSTFLYFKNKDLAKAYADAKFSGCEYKLNEITAALDETSGHWTILDKTQRILSIDSETMIDGKHAIFSKKIDGFSLPTLGDFAIGLTARPAQLKAANKAKPLRRPTFFVVEGYVMEFAASIKDVTHVFCDVERLLYMATPRKEPVDLVSSAEIATLIAELGVEIKKLDDQQQHIKNIYGAESRELHDHIYAHNTESTDLIIKMSHLKNADAKPMRSYMDESIRIKPVGWYQM